MEDSLAKIDKQYSVADLETKFEFEKIKNENEAKQIITAGEIKRQKNFRNSLIILLGLMVSWALLFL